MALHQDGQNNRRGSGGGQNQNDSLTSPALLFPHCFKRRRLKLREDKHLLKVTELGIPTQSDCVPGWNVPPDTTPATGPQNWGRCWVTMSLGAVF
ncbi:uncharacterized protein LOC143674688 isoform X2 [Tamandua tetradactyla]|uniref:uncharacterized protein LOC143674688 isoform X2 n=1 Tax=Tamandua tetradactyla TaxID=48850 RepID=UPI0040548B71